MSERAFLRHQSSGDVFAVELNEDGTAARAAGPLYYKNITAAHLAAAYMGAVEDEDDAAWLNNQSVRVVEPSDYYEAAEQ